MDSIEIIGAGSIIQHGTYNNRIYLMKLNPGDYPGIIPVMEEKAAREGYGKITAKVPASVYDGFVSSGYKKEAFIPRYFPDETDLYFVSRFLDVKRAVDPREERCDDVVSTAISREKSSRPRSLQDPYSCRLLDDRDVQHITEVYKQVFKTYPFPIFDCKYIKKTMKENLIYFGVFLDKKELVSVSSTEMDMENKSVEMTDFSTLPEYRGNGFAACLLSRMEEEMDRMGIRTFYTIARSMSYGMNITFAKNSYIYSGRLVNNTNISGSIESMNIWYKIREHRNKSK
jgi:putative beta-lysine N-acetyltransferase